MLFASPPPPPKPPPAGRSFAQAFWAAANLGDEANPRPPVGALPEVVPDGRRPDPKFGKVAPWLFRHDVYAAMVGVPLADGVPLFPVVVLECAVVVVVVDEELTAAGAPPPHAANVTATAAIAAPAPMRVRDRVHRA
ncbi:MAG: hypothetical protein JWO62_1642 [Acidimicrobiaceae bacterium]|nr:hypothetical protein [Acidimicrobiaceae bacterium]